MEDALEDPWRTPKTTQLTLEDALEDHTDTSKTKPTQLTLEDALEDHTATVNIGGRTRRPHRHS